MIFPKIDKIANSPRFVGFFKPALMRSCKKVINELRELNSQLSQEQIEEKIAEHYAKFANLQPRKIINATGIVVHTNLGRSPLNPELIARASNLLTTYSNLEYDLNSGKRGERTRFSAELLKLLFDCEDALIVNNNAAAVFLVLNTLCAGKEVVTSRGELVEIGGSFRIPEVVIKSGAILREVGTTNKTKISDYESAICENTALLMKTHKSNYDIAGFSREVSAKQIAQIASEFSVISYYDLGSGYVGTLPNSLSLSEPNLDAVLSSDIDIISFSGDKLFGSVQCGIILGKKSLIDKLRQNQLLRMLRVDKITLALLNETIKAYLNKEYSLISSINQIHKSLAELEKNAKKVLDSCQINAQIIHTKTFVGGGALPNKTYPSIAIAFENAQETESEFRKKGIIGRIEEDKFLLDFRSILDEQIPELSAKIKEIYG